MAEKAAASKNCWPSSPGFQCKAVGKNWDSFTPLRMAAKSIQLSHACAASLVDLSQIRRRIWGVISKIDWRKLARSRFLGDIWNLASTKLQVHHCPCNIRQTLWGLIMGGFSRLKGYPNKIHSGSGSIGEQLPISVASPAPQQQSRSP